MEEEKKEKVALDEIKRIEQIHQFNLLLFIYLIKI